LKKEGDSQRQDIIMTSRVRVTNVVVLNNPCKFFDPFQFQITFECLEISNG